MTEVPQSGSATPKSASSVGERPGSHVPSSSEVKKIYESAVSARSRKFPLAQICKTLQQLGQCPTEATIQEIYAAYTPEDQPEGVAATIDLAALTEIINEHSYSRDERFNQLNDAFLYFDKQEAGVIESEILKEKLLTVGDCFTDKEANEFFKEAKPSSDGKLPYDDFLRRLVDAFPRPQSKKKSAKSSAKKSGEKAKK